MMHVTVIGAGNGGFAAAADLSLRKFAVTLFEHPAFAASISLIKEKGVIGLSTLPSTGLAGGFAQLERVTTDIKEAVLDAEVVLVVVPAFAQGAMAREMAPYLKRDQTVVLMPGGFGGSILFWKHLKEENPSSTVLLGETSTLPYACRKLDSASVWIRGRKNTFDLAAYPSPNTDRVLAIVKVLYPAARKAYNILETGLNNLNPFIHPPIVLMNVGSTERKDRVLFYHEGITHCVESLTEGLDGERMALGKSLGLSLKPAYQVLLDHYGHQGARGRTFMEVAGQNPVYRWSEMPPNVDSRYLTEDIPMNLMPICALAKQAGTPSKVMESVITISEQVLGKDLSMEARTLKELGLEGLTVDEILRMF
jgi:opine dehydrogenase